MSPRLATPLLRACSLSTALALVACSPDNSRSALVPTSPALSRASVALPFRGTVETSTKSMQPLGPTTALAHSEGGGNASHLGRFEAGSDLTLDLAKLTGTAEWALTAANGDVLTATTIGHATPNADGMTLTVVELATITGGTGRFAGATGSGFYHGEFDARTGHVITVTYDFMISAPKK